MGTKRSRQRPITNQFSARVENSLLSESRNLWDFSQRLIKGTLAFRIWERCAKYVRRFRIITTVFRVFPWILLAISTNTLLYVIAAMAVIFAPPLLIGLLSFAGSALIRYKKVNEQMTRHLSGKTVFVLFPTRDGEFAEAHFWRANARELASHPSSAVVVVSPFLLSPRGLEEGRFYLNMRSDGDNLFLVRRHYFFSLRKHVLTRSVKRLILLY